jgi:type III restriction enzyme
MQEIKTYKTADLVLQVNKNYDPTKLDLIAWGRYLDILCDNRQFQKEAIQCFLILKTSAARGEFNFESEPT